MISDALHRLTGIQLGQEGAVSRAALQQLVVELVGASRADEVAPFIGEAMGVPYPETAALRVARDDPSVMRERVTRAVVELARAAGQRGLVALYLDDLQWGDEESLALCEHLLAQLEELPLFLVASCRPELLERRPGLFEAIEALRLEVRPLGRRSLRKICDAVLEGEVDAAAVAVVARQWDGNPFFAEELIAWLVEKGALSRVGGRWELCGEVGPDPSPVSLPVVIQARLDALPSRQKELLKAAAVFGEVLWEEGCGALGFPEARQRLELLRGAGLLLPDRRSRFARVRQWRFRHALLQQTAYEMLARDQLPRLHELAADWLKRAGEHDAALLAHHYQRAGDLAQAAEHYGRAGARALAEGQLESAVDYLERALEYRAAAPEHRVETALELARARYLRGEYTDGLRVIDELEGELDAMDGRRRIRTSWLKGRLLLSTGRYEEAEAILGEGAAAADRRGERDLAFGVRHALFWVLWCQGSYGKAAEVADRLYRVAHEHERPEELCSAKLALAYSNLAGDLSRSLTLAQEALEHARAVGHPYREVDALLLLGSLQVTTGQFERALETLRRAHQQAGRHGTRNHLASIEMSRGHAYLLQGDAATALEHYCSAAQLAGAIGDPRTEAGALVGQARALLLAGGGGQASLEIRALAERALDVAGDHIPPVAAEAHAVLASLAAADGQLEEAFSRARLAVEIVQRLGDLEQCEIEVLLAAYDVLRIAGHDAEARETLARTRRRLELRCDKISDPEVRRSFRQNVPFHVRVLRAG
jgi:tetratricopeptide (TPR) repeat protein